MDSKHPPGSVELYRWEIGAQRWLVDAVVTGNGDLVVTSGDTETEWQAIVLAPHLDDLAKALFASIDWPIHRTAGILELLHARFYRAGSNPFDDIKRFLGSTAIPWESQVW